MSFPEMIRNVAVVGHLHHGKTALMDMLVFETHKLDWDADKPVRDFPSYKRENLNVGFSCVILIHTHFLVTEKFR